MHLNPILFPAPKRKYTPELLMGELIYIPKYKTPLKPSTSLNIPTHKTSHSMSCNNVSRNPPSFINDGPPSVITIKNLTCKQSRLGAKTKEEGGYHVHSKSAFEFFRNDEENKHSTRILNQLESFEAYENIILKSNLQNIQNNVSEKEYIKILPNRYTGYNDEKDDTVIQNISHTPNQSFLIKSPLNKKSGFQSGDISFEGMVDSPVKTGPVFLEKKFVINQLSNKVSKASTGFRDDYSNIGSNQTSTTHSKKPSRQGCDLSIVGEDYETNLDFELAEEFPVQANLFSSPQTISSYTTKTNEKSFMFKRLMTEYSFQASGEFKSFKKVDLSAFYHQDHKSQPAKDVIGHIPCLILKSGVPSNKILMYFHGNGEDVYLSYDLLAHIRNNLNVHVLGIEYPGYGLYQGEPNEEKILADAETIFNYLVTDLGFEPKNIIVFGRSIGSGPATWLASKKEVGALTLMSAFTSIRGVVRDFAGRLVQYFVKERFNNLENITKVRCPTFIVHGLKDNFISYKHSQDLYNSCKSLCELILPREMNHAEFDFYEDFTEPFMDFLKRGNYKLEMDTPNETAVDFPLHLFGVPGKGSTK